MPGEQEERFYLWRRRQWTAEREYGPWNVETQWTDAAADAMRQLATDDPEVVEVVPAARVQELEGERDRYRSAIEAHRDSYPIWFQDAVNAGDIPGIDADLHAVLGDPKCTCGYEGPDENGQYDQLIAWDCPMHGAPGNQA